MLLARASSPPSERCLACGHSRQGVQERARCPECGTSPLHELQPNQSQAAFISTARSIFAICLFILAASGQGITTQPGVVRAVFTIGAFAAVWNWPQLWVSHPPALRAKARVRLGVATGIAVGLLLTGVIGQSVAKSLLRLEPDSMLAGSVTATFLLATAFAGWAAGKWWALRVLARSSLPPSA